MRSHKKGRHSCAKSNIKKVSLELGGKSPLLVFADADMERAVRQTATAVFFNKGENCIAAGRIFVARSIHDSFVQKLVAETRKITIGDPLDRSAPPHPRRPRRSTGHGPQNHKAHLDKLIEYVAKALKDGAKLEIGGKRADRPGLFFEPTILSNVADDNFAAKEESFGPVMVVSAFDDESVLSLPRVSSQ